MQDTGKIKCQECGAEFESHEEHERHMRKAHRKSETQKAYGAGSREAQPGRTGDRETQGPGGRDRESDQPRKP